MSTSTSILALFTPAGAAIGTGIRKIVAETGKNIPPSFVTQVVQELPGLFGGYPTHADIAPSAIFIAVFSLITIGHAYVFATNRRFYPSLGLAFYALFRVIGFGTRIAWAKSLLSIDVGIASTAFSQVSVLYLNIMTVLLGHRVLQARNPKLGGAWWFNAGMSIIYFFVLAVIAMAIVGQAVPYIYFLSPSHFNICKRVTRAAAILEILYSAMAGGLIILAAILRVTARHFHQNEGANITNETEKATDSEHSNPNGAVNTEAAAVRPNHLKITRFVALHIIGSSILLTINCSFRAAATFTETNTNWIFDRTVFYVLYGAVEAFVNIFYLVFRIQDHFDF